jgi:hypothetical protein
MVYARLGVVAALLSVSLMTRHVEAQTPPPKYIGRIVGIYDDRTGNPLDSVEVSDLTTKSFALTTSTGTLSLFFVDSVGGLLRFRKLGYKPLTMFVDNGPEFAPLTVTLEPLAQQLPAVVTVDTAPVYRSPQLRGFEDRRKAGIGKFVPEFVIRREENRRLGDLINFQIPGVEVKEVRDGTRWVMIATTKRAGSPCPVDIYVDGIFVSARTTAGGQTIGGRGRGAGAGGGTSANDLGDYQPTNLAGIEFYSAATIPAEFNRMGSGCGALFLWSRER